MEETLVQGGRERRRVKGRRGVERATGVDQQRACSQAGETDCGASRALMANRFQTPRKVPGNSMKANPVAMKVASSRDGCNSRARSR